MTERYSPDEPVIDSSMDVAGMAIHMKYMRADMKEMKDTLHNITSNYVPINSYLEHKADTEKRLAVLEEKTDALKEFKDTLIGRMWGIGLLAGFVVGIVTFLAEHYIR